MCFKLSCKDPFISFLATNQVKEFFNHTKGIRAATILMAGDEITMRLQKDVGASFQGLIHWNQREEPSSSSVHVFMGDFKGWWSKLEQFFEVEGVKEQVKDTYARGLQESFGSTNFLDPMIELVTLIQQESMDQFHDQFVSIFNRLHIPEIYNLSIFTSKLKKNVLVRGSGGYSKPLFPNLRMPVTSSNVLTSGGPLAVSGGQRTPTKSLSQEKMEDRRKKGLCFWCASKYTPRHKCVKSQLYQLIVEPQLDSMEDNKAKQWRNIRIVLSTWRKWTKTLNLQLQSYPYMLYKDLRVIIL
ncbi:hypothetical protein CXB51_017131 [Gossypium anomalum]|uniref:Retrotransposon gag domain-containing protein n=1 Tax=Gossypium anomalum TaxID=47600 RepID=A0A8J6D2N8_9ROSI|nr:hypothetical protein CXB51_017131 [Gossypium anomalum]